MARSESITKSVSIDEVRQHLNELLHEVATGGTSVLVEEDGQPIAGIVSVRELEMLSRLGSEWLQRFEPLLRSWTAFSDESPERIEHEIEQALSG